MVQETSNAISDRTSNELVWKIIESIIWDWNVASVVLIRGVNYEQILYIVLVHVAIVVDLICACAWESQEAAYHEWCHQNDWINHSLTWVSWAKTTEFGDKKLAWLQNVCCVVYSELPIVCETFLSIGTYWD